MSRWPSLCGDTEAVQGEAQMFFLVYRRSPVVAGERLILTGRPRSLSPSPGLDGGAMNELQSKWCTSGNGLSFSKLDADIVYLSIMNKHLVGIFLAFCLSRFRQVL